MPRLRANVAVCEPTRPMPTTPRVLEDSSLPTKRLRSHFPPLREETADGILRASENIMAMVCSAVVMTLPSGAFTTKMPRTLAASRSTLSTPDACARDHLERIPDTHQFIIHLRATPDDERVGCLDGFENFFPRSGGLVEDFKALLVF